MLIVRLVLLCASAVGFLGVLALLVRDLRREILARREAGQDTPEMWLDLVRWRTAARGVVAAGLSLMLGLSIVVVPPGFAAVRVSDLWGPRPGTLYPGVHVVRPLVEGVQLYDVREHLMGTDPGGVPGLLSAQTKEGLTVKLAVSARTALDPERLERASRTLPPDPEATLVPPVLAAAFRDAVPTYTVREVFGAKRDELRRRVTEEVTRRLRPDGIVVREVVLRDVILPPEYARSLESVLLKEQKVDEMVYDVQLKEKEVRTAELVAEANKVRRIKDAEASAAERVLLAKAEADAMQHTLPLKQKLIEQSRLEAQARKEATVQDASAAAEAKVIDSRAEAQKSDLMADAEAKRVRVIGVASAEKLRVESDILKENPLLIQKIVAERLSDRMQIMMVPTDGRDFFAGDVLKSALAGALATPPPTPAASPAPTRTAQKRR